MRKKTAIAVFGLWGAGVLALLLVLGGIDLVAPPVHAQWNSTLTGRGNTGNPAIAEYCTPAVQASDVSGTASVVNALNTTASCTVPAACAAGCRAAISWNVRVQAAANTGIEFWVTDGTNNFESVHTNGQTTDVTGAAQAIVATPVEYTTGTITFTLETQGNTGASYTVEAAPSVGSGANSGMQVILLPTAN